MKVCKWSNFFLSKRRIALILKCKIIWLIFSNRAKLICARALFFPLSTLCTWLYLELFLNLLPMFDGSELKNQLTYKPNIFFLYRKGVAVFLGCKIVWLSLRNWGRLSFTHMSCLQHRSSFCFMSAWPLYKVCEFIPTFFQKIYNF